MLRSKFVKFLMSNLIWQVNSSSNFASFFIVMTHNSSVDFKLIIFLLWIKGSHQNSNFEGFECSGEKYPCSSCQFPNHKSVFPQNFLILCTIGANEIANFGHLRELRSNLIKFLSLLKQKIRFF